MAFGAGKYDDLCTAVRVQSRAAGAIVIILGGPKGNGFSVQADWETIARLPELLEEIAKTIRKDRDKIVSD